MSINNSIAGSSLSPSDHSHSSTVSRFTKPSCIKKLNKKHLFGLALLMIVDLIWVGSAGLTKYLFKNQQYNKPLFTVYFKTILFTIYLLPFLFWRPWQRLCCNISFRKRATISPSINQTTTPSTTDNNGRSNYGSFDQNTKTDALVQRGLESSSISMDASTDYSNSSSFNSTTSLVEDEKLSPSKYAPLKLKDDNRYDTNSLDMPRKILQPSNKYLTLSTSVPLSRRKPSHVRFCQTVEVKTMPISQHHQFRSDPDDTIIPQQKIPIVSVRVVMVLALVFGILWFFANYLYAQALVTQSVAAVNTLSSLSGVFVLILAAIPLPRLADKDRFSLTKLLIIILSVGGAIMIGLSSSSGSDKDIDVGALYSVAGSCLYATYLVLLSKFLPHPDSLEVPMFFGFVGLLDGILLIPLVVLWHYFGIETFELPPTNEIWTILLVNGFVGTVLSELLWLWGCLLTSSLVGTLSLSLVTPLSITYSIIVSDAQFSITFFFGAAVIVLTFVLISILDHTSGIDPVWLALKQLWNCIHSNHNTHKDYDDLCDESKDLLKREASPDDFDGSPPP